MKLSAVTPRKPDVGADAFFALDEVDGVVPGDPVA